MGYQLGIDLGTTFTAAAVQRDQRVEVVSLGDRAPSIPSVIFLREDGAILTGDAANRRALHEPNRVAREFKRRLGDPTPVLLGGVPYPAEVLTARLLGWVAGRVAAGEGAAPDHVVITHPANWGPYKLDLLSQAVRHADLDTSRVSYLSEPQAAAVFYSSQARVEQGAVVAVYDLGGGTFDAALLRRVGDGFELLGQPEGIERLGGIDVDAAVWAHVWTSLGTTIDDLDPDDGAVQAGVSHLQQECVAAKEVLSSDTDVRIPVLIPGIQGDVRLTRSELEAMVRPVIAETLTALRRAIRGARVDTEEIEAVLLVGGSSRMPLVAQMVGAEVGRPVAVDAHPKHAVALGAAVAAAVAAGHRDTGAIRAVVTETEPPVTAAVPIVVPGAPHSQPATAFAATGDLAQTEGAPATAFAAHGDLPQTEGAPGVGAFAATTGAGAATQPAATGDLPATQPPSGGSSGYLAGDSSPPPAAIGYGATGGLPPTLPPPDASTGYLAAQAPTTGAVAPTGRWDGVDPTLVPGTVPAAGIAPAPAGDRSEWSDRSSLPPAGASGAPRATSPAGTGPGAPTGRRRLLVAAMLAVLVVAVVGVGLVILVNNGDQKGETAAGESDGAGDPASSTTQPADSPEAAVPADAPPLSADGRLRPVFGGGSPAEPASPSAPASLSSMRFAEAGDFERVAVGFGSATPPAISGTNVRADIGQLRVYFADPLPEPTADLEFLGVEKHLVHGVVFARAIFPGGTPYRWVDIYTTKPAKLEAYRVAASDSLESLVVVDIEEDPAVDLATWNTFKLDGPLREGHLGTTLRPESPDKLHVEGYAIRHDGKGELILTNNADTSITVEAETEAEPSPGYSVFFVDIDIKGLPSGDYELKWTSENREDFIDGVPPKVKVTVTLP